MITAVRNDRRASAPTSIQVRCPQRSDSRLRGSRVARALARVGWVAWGLQAAAVAAEPASTPLATPNATGPKITFAEPVYDFGEVKRGEVVRHTFVFTNTGNETLKILGVRPSCGCTAAGDWNKEVAPGRTGSIPIQLSSAGFGGVIAKSVAVTCNDPTQANLHLQIKGKVWVPIEVTPNSAVFQYEAGTTNSEERIVRIVSNLKEPLKLEEPQFTNRAFKVELKPVKPGQEYAVHISTVPPVGTGNVVAPISIRTSAPEMPVIALQAYAVERQAVVVSPRQIILPRSSSAGAVRPSVTIQNFSSNPLILSNATINAPGIEVQVRELQPGRMFQVSVQFPPDFKIEPNQKLELGVESNHPRFARIQVPVFQAPATAPTRRLPAQPTASLVSTQGSTRVGLPVRSVPPPFPPVPLGPAPAAQPTKP